jgi:benzoyl-CoA reductase/2-hydroxyglutaryl-CoA dehydratase subunit BcrC/BadD/HgdB
MSRRTYIQGQQRAGRKAVAVLPVHYPKPLLTAMDVLAVELWGPPGPPRGADAGRVQTYVCALVRNALAFLASGGAGVTDGVLFPHTCDSIQGLASVAPDVAGWSGPTLRYIHPKGDPRPSSRAFVRRELERLAAGLAELTGRALDPDRLRWALDLHRRIDAIRMALLDNRRRLPLSGRELYELLRRGEYLWPEEHLAELDAAQQRLEHAPAQRGVPLMVTGYVPEPMALLDALDAAGALVVADDYAAVGRRLPRDAKNLPDHGMEALVELSFAGPPCPTRAERQMLRLAHLERLYVESGAAGLLVHVVKFCEPELFDVPAIRKQFAHRPVLVIESELEAELSGQTATRIEAFVEMVAAQEAA